MDILIFGTLWFWIFFAVIGGGIICILESALYDSNDNGGGGWATLLLFAGIVAYYHLGSKEDVVNILNYIKNNPFNVIGYFFAYVGIGILWAFIKWYFFVHNKLQYVKERKEHNKSTRVEVPKARDNKYRIMSWMYYWVFSALWTLINEPLKKSFDYAYTKIGSTFDKISERMFGSLVKQDEIDQAEIKAQKEKEAEEWQNRNKKKQQLNS